MHHPRLSVVITTFNEQDHIGSCLNSVSWAAEKIVVDGESTDRTREIAQAHGAKVLVRPNHPMLNLNKNFGFEQANGDWVMSLDSDERVTDALRDEILRVLPTSTCNGYRIPLRTFFWGRMLRNAAGYPAVVTRICRKGTGRFGTDYVHQGLKVEGRVNTMQACLHHYPARNLYELLAKLNFNTSMTAEYFHRRGASASLMRAVCYAVGDFFWRYFVRGAFRDRSAGFALCAVRSMYMLVWHMKLWELQRSNVSLERPDTHPQSLPHLPR